MPPLATALRHQGRHAEAAAVLDRAEAIARRTDMPGVVADVLDQRAHLAADDDLDTAFDLHHEALRLRVDHGLRTSQIVSLEALAARMAPTRRAVHATRSLAAATRARASIGVPRHPLADAMHATTVTQLRDALGDDGYDAAWCEGWRLTLDEAVVLIRRARGRRARPATGWGSLTPTELQVVALVVDGLSNPDIAAKLLMRRSTVKSHLSHIFAKLEVSNRIELAAVAAPRLGDIR
jgi:DNA-binding NarL/FixJ family response regulator